MSSTRPALERDLDLVRDILIWAENGMDRNAKPENGDERFRYHCKLMKEAGLIEAVMTSGTMHGGPAPSRVEVTDITWKGHDFLKAVRNDTIWNSTKARMREHGIPMMFELVLGAAKALAAQHGLSGV